jgi:methylmalonyl-CoA mutase N-terminal domain/subunit
MRDRYGAKLEKSMQMRFHTQTAGVSLTAQQPEVNIVRTAIEALAGVLGGTQSLHTNSMDETLALPSEKSARIALRTQQVIANETRVTNVADPLGGSYYVEALTDEMERRAEELFAQIENMGDGSLLDGAVRGVEEGWYQSHIADAAYDLERKLNAGRHVIVGVNRFLEGSDEPPPPILRIGPEAEEEQRRRLDKVKRARDSAAVDAALTRVRADAAEPDVNLMPAFIDAVRVDATLGEIVDALADVFGRWVEAARI